MLGMNIRTSVTGNQVEFLQQQGRISSGQRINRPSEDPAVANRILNVSELLNLNVQLGDNAAYADHFLAATDATLGDVNSVVIEAQVLANEHVGSLISAEERRAAATVVDSLIDRLMATANTKYRDEHLFGGSRTTIPPFIATESGIEFVGNQDALTAFVVSNELVHYNGNGAAIFDAVSTAQGANSDLSPALLSTTRLADLAGTTGNGIRLGTINITDGSSTALVDLQTASTIEDVINAINSSAAGIASAAIAPDGRSIELTGGGSANLEVGEVGGSQTAGDLGLLTTSPAGNILDGADVGSYVTPLTELGQLNDGAGVSLSTPIRITLGAQSIDVDLSSAQTVEDVLNALNSTGLGIEARINADRTGIEVVNRISGATMSIGEVGGSTATQLGIRTLDSTTLLSDLNGGAGVQTVTGADFRITAADGSIFDVDASGAVTIADLISAINAAASGSGTSVAAGLTTTGNGIDLIDSSGGSGQLSVEQLNSSEAMFDLGLATTPTGGVLTGQDVGGQRTGGLFTRLAELRDALENDDTVAIGRAGAALEEAGDLLRQHQGEIGARSRSAAELLIQTDSAVDSSLAALSNARDLDMAEAIAHFASLESSMTANLATAGQLMTTSLMDFLR
jgi:flagellar hook-associated protein 3 FlgL